MPPLADDILHGADQIAVFLFGDRRQRRRVYYLKESGQLPTFEMGGICARKSTLLAWIAQQESLHFSEINQTNEEAA
ncbi:MAG TPA: hypothetical protein VGL35_11125 [Rhizomicrobium sp.]|jgi:hypothetical protein